MQGDGEKLSRWAEHFKEVVNCQVGADVVSPHILPVVPYPSAASNTLLSDKDLSAPLSKVEIRAVMSKLRPGRAPGLNEISLEMLGLGEDETVHGLKTVFDTIWETESVPEDWLSQLLVPLHKKGSRTICDNYRGITLLNIPGKVFAKAILQ